MFNALLLISLLLPLISAQCGLGAVYDSTNNRCLQFFRSAIDFQGAEDICAALNGNLVSIHNSIDNAFVSSEARKYFNGYTWLGAKTTAADPNDPLNWYWTDGTNFDFQNYGPGEPSSQGYTACMQLDTETFKWSTANCEEPLPFVCSNASSVTPTCPPIPSHCPSGYTWFNETDFCYRSTTQFTNYDDARSACQADGGDLASIHSQAENQFLVDLSKTGITNTNWSYDVFIGLIYENSVWQWTDGSEVTYLNWADGEPNNMNREWWTSLVPDPHNFTNTEGTRWNNMGMIDLRAFICKRAPLH